MSAEIDVTVSGIPELVEALGTDFVEELQTNIGQAVQNIVNNILEEARMIVPVRTGYLLSTIHSEQVTAWSFQLLASAPYAGYVEWGTSRMAAEPYMNPAIQMYSADFAQKINAGVVASAQNAGLVVT